MRRGIKLVLTAVVVAVVVAGPALATSTKTPFSASTTVTEVDPGNTWMSGHIFHIRGEIDEGPVSGDLVGSITLVINANIDLNSGMGRTFGNFTLATSDVTWEGSFSGAITGETSSEGRFIGQGTDGTKLKGAFTQVSADTFDLEGTILSPHG